MLNPRRQGEHNGGPAPWRGPGRPCIMPGHPFIRIKGYISLEPRPMSKSAYLFTSESVSEGHPDKVADQISDAVLDAILAQDKRARVACETMVKTGVAIVAGEIGRASCRERGEAS